MIKIKPFKQGDDSRCGPASIKMVLDYYGIDVSEDEIAKRCNHTYFHGCTNRDAVKAFKSYGLEAEIKENCTVEDIKYYLDNDIPVIVDWFTGGKPKESYNIANGHYSVVVGINDKYIHLIDPEYAKKRRIKINDFLRVWFDWEKDNILNKKSRMYYQTMIIATEKFS